MSKYGTAPKCPETGYTVNSAYQLGCRCDACKAARREYSADYARKRSRSDPEFRKRRLRWAREYKWRKRYGLSVEDYQYLLDHQDGGCALCEKTPEENGRRLSVDHNHETGAVRGLLCTRCNRGLHDSIEWHLKAVAYLKEDDL